MKRLRTVYEHQTRAIQQLDEETGKIDPN